MFQTRRIQVEAVQCMSCGRFRIDGVWTHADVRSSEVSHTFCPECVPALRERLLREREFRHQDLEHQVNMLRDELVLQTMDEEGLRHRLRFLDTDPASVESLVSRVRDLLVETLCRYCGRPLQPGQGITQVASYHLHEECAQRMRENLREMRRIHVPEGNLDSYMDILQVPHEVRPGVREMLARE